MERPDHAGWFVLIWQLHNQLFNSVHTLASEYLYTMRYLPFMAEQKEVFEMVFDETGLPTREHKEIIPKDPETIFTWKTSHLVMCRNTLC